MSGLSCFFFATVFLLSVGGFAQAQDSLPFSSQRDPRQSGGVNALLRQGVKEEVAGELGAAMGYFNRVLDQDPRNANALFNIGAIFEKQHELGRALHFYELALSSAPEDQEIRRAVEAVRTQISDQTFNAPELIPGRVESDCQSASVSSQPTVQSGPMRISGWFVDELIKKGTASENSGQFDVAESYFRQALKYDPGSEAALFHWRNVSARCEPPILTVGVPNHQTAQTKIFLPPPFKPISGSPALRSTLKETGTILENTLPSNRFTNPLCPVCRWLMAL